MIAQEQLAAKAHSLYAEVDALVDLIRGAIKETTPVHVVEENVLGRARGRSVEGRFNCCLMRWEPVTSAPHANFPTDEC